MPAIGLSSSVAATSSLATGASGIGLDHAGRVDPGLDEFGRFGARVGCAGEHGDAETSGLGDGQGGDGTVEHVGLQLRQREILCTTADGAKLADLQPGLRGSDAHTTP